LVGVPANRISQIVAGRRNVTADTALRLGRYFGTSPHFWINLQKAYELDRARAEIGPALERIPQRPANEAVPSDRRPD
jgi:plasmid maintenance system antidote protein VapI